MSETLEAYARRILNVGDIHGDAYPSAVFKESVEDFVLGAIEEYRPDITVLHGDIFDNKISLESQASKDINSFVHKLISKAQAYNMEIIILKGTLSHDYSQLENFRELEIQHDFFHVVETCKELELRGGFRVLVIPEEYPEDVDQFYFDKFYETIDGQLCYKQYDAIWGHGQIDKFSRYTALLESESFLHKTPVLKADELLQMTSGTICFGHIHVHMKYKTRLISLGSVTRWAQGEEQPKGLTIVDAVLNQEGIWQNEIYFIPNEKAPLYHTIFPADVFAPDHALEEMLEYFKNEAVKYAKLRIDFNGFNISAETYAVLSEALNKVRNIQCVRSARVMREIKDEETSEVTFEEVANITSYNTKFDYLSDKSTPLEQRIAQYIQDDVIGESVTVTQDEIISLING